MLLQSPFWSVRKPREPNFCFEAEAVAVFANNDVWLSLNSEVDRQVETFRSTLRC